MSLIVLRYHDLDEYLNELERVNAEGYGGSIVRYAGRRVQQPTLIGALHVGLTFVSTFIGHDDRLVEATILCGGYIDHDPEDMPPAMQEQKDRAMERLQALEQSLIQACERLELRALPGTLEVRS